MLIAIAMDGVYTGLTIAPLCIVVVLAGWVIYASCQKREEARLTQPLVENEIV
jgi:hypothetical protein